MRNFDWTLFILKLTTKIMATIRRKQLSLIVLLSIFLLSVGWQLLLTPHINAQTRVPTRLLSWQGVFTDDSPPVPQKPGGRRDGSPVQLCTIAPEQGHQQIWSNRPLFIWQGDVNKIEVRSLGNELLWQQVVTPTQRSALYTGEELQSGQSYQWLFRDQQDKRRASVLFQVLGTQERDRIKMELDSVEKELQAKKATAEEKAMYRARYFAQQNLWSDFWREVFSVDKPSKALTEIAQAKTTELCTKSLAQQPSSFP